MRRVAVVGRAAAPRVLPRTLPEALRWAVIAGAVLFAELLIALAVVSPRLAPLVAVPALVVAAMAVMRWPLLGMAALLVLTSSFLPAKLFVMPAGPLQVRGFELVLAGMLALALVAPRRRTWGGAPGVAIAAFLGLLGLSSALAVSAGTVEFGTAFAWSRDFGVLTVFYVIVRLFPTRADLDRLFVVAVATAAVTGFVAVLLATTSQLPSFFEMTGQGFASQQEGITGDLNRVRLPGTALAYVLLWFAALRLIRAHGWARAGWTVAVLGMLLALAVSFNRNMWVGAIAGLFALLVLGGPRVRRSFALFGAVCVVAVSAAVVAGVGIDRTSAVRPIVERGTSLFDPGRVTRENSLEDRANETDHAWAVAKRNLLFGIAPGVPFGSYYSERQADGTYRPSVQLFVHNQYLYLLLIVGIPGTLAFAAFVGGALWRGLGGIRDPDVLAWTVAIGMVALSAVVMIAFSTADMLMGLGLLTAAVVASTPPRPLLAGRRRRS